MRKTLGKPVYAREGSLVRVDCRLPEGVDLVRLSAWFSCDGVDYSPLILLPGKNLVLTDKPPFFKPVMYRAETDSKREQFVAQETGYYRIDQELDVPDDKLSRSSIYVPSKFRLKVEAIWARFFHSKEKVTENVEQASTSRR